jgi:hypothetical protein
MVLHLFKIGSVNYFCSELQIKEAGSLKAAAEKMAGIKPKADAKEPGDKKPIEK